MILEMEKQKIYKHQYLKIHMRKTLLLLFVISLISFISAEMSYSKHVNMQFIDNSGNVITGTYNMTFNWTTNIGCTNILNSTTATITTDARGIISHYIPNPSIEYNQTLYLCIYRNGALVNNSLITPVPQAEFARNTTTKGLIYDSNITNSLFDVIAKKFFGVFDWFIKSDSSQYLTFNGTTLSFSENQLNKTIALYTSNLSITNNTIYNQTYHGLISNASYLSTYNSTYDIWAYNMTKYNDTIYNSTYNQWAYNQSLSNTITIWLYNQTQSIYYYNQTATHFFYNMTNTHFFYNMTDTRFYYNFSLSENQSTYNFTYQGLISNTSYLSTYNATYDIWAYNMSDGTGINNTIYNFTYQGLINNASYLSTFNTTYAQWAYNQSLSNTITKWLYNQSLSNTITKWLYNQTLLGDNLYINMNSTSYFINENRLNLTIARYTSNLTASSNNTIYNKTYDTWAYNQSLSNTITKWLYNQSLSSTITPWLYNQTIASGWNKLGTNVILGTSTDKVGIGTATPSHSLNVVGDSNFTGNIYGDIVNFQFTNPSTDTSNITIALTSTLNLTIAGVRAGNGRGFVASRSGSLASISVVFDMNVINGNSSTFSFLSLSKNSTLLYYNELSRVNETNQIRIFTMNRGEYNFSKGDVISLKQNASHSILPQIRSNYMIGNVELYYN